MIKNMGLSDRMVRLALAVVITGLYFTNNLPQSEGLVFLAIAGIFMFTSCISFYPIYGPFGLDTTKKKDKQSR